VKLKGWGCFRGKQRGPRVPLKAGSVNARVYRDLLRHWLLPVHAKVRSVVGNPLSQQYNAKPANTDILKRYAVPLESQPAYSSELDPTELVWTLLKRQLRADNPDLTNYPGGPEKMKAMLAEVLPLCWEKILQAVCGAMEDSVLFLLGSWISLPAGSHRAARIILLSFSYPLHWFCLMFCT